jgi:hypothetical protein
MISDAQIIVIRLRNNPRHASAGVVLTRLQLERLPPVLSLFHRKKMYCRHHRSPARGATGSLSGRRRLPLIVCAVTMCACVYLHLLVKHGTVMPLAAWYYTVPFQPAGWAGAPSQASNHDLELLEKYLAGQGPPDDWRPSSRM